MAFPASGTRESLAGVFVRVQRTAHQLREAADALKAKAQAGTANARDLMEFATRLADCIAEFNAAAATPGIGPYAQEQVGDPTLDIAAEFTAMVSAATSTRDWIVANVPKSADGYFLGVTVLSTGRYQWRAFGAAALSALTTRLDALIATIS